MLSKSLAYASANRTRFTSELLELLRIPSISTLSEHKPDIQTAAGWIAQSMKSAGLEHVEVMPTKGNPVVYGDWLNAEDGAPTVLVYGHYDVQPVDPIELWETPPFDPQIRDGKLYARGASDDKGQMFIHIKAIESMLAANQALPANIKMIVEGEEEVGSPNLEEFILSQKELLAASSGLISDGRIISSDEPSLNYALRGMAYLEFRVRGPKRDLHSGSYGGSVHNPVQLVSEIIAATHDDNGTVQIPGFYDKVLPLSDEERRNLGKSPYTLEQWQDETGLTAPWGESDFTFIERSTARPTCEVNGIWGGFQGEGAKTIIPSEGGAKVSMRLVANQDPTEVAVLFKDFVASFIPPDYSVEFKEHVRGWPALTPIDSHEIQAASKAFAATWGKQPVMTREGGSIPIVATIQKELGAPVVLMGFGLDDNIHSPNERFDLSHFERGIDTVIHYYYFLTGQA